MFTTHECVPKWNICTVYILYKRSINIQTVCHGVIGYIYSIFNEIIRRCRGVARILVSGLVGGGGGGGGRGPGAGGRGPGGGGGGGPYL